MIYFLKEVESDYVKIGYSSDLELRVLNLAQGNPRTLEIVRLISNCLKGDEKLVRDKFRKNLVRGDWFLFEEEMLTFSLDEIKKGLYSITNQYAMNVSDKLLQFSIKKEINFVLSQLLSLNRLFIDTKTIASHLEMLESTIKDNIDDYQLSKIKKHNIDNFGTNNKRRYERIKDISTALLSHNSISNACENVNIPIKEFLYNREIIFGDYKYVHFNLNEKDYYF